MNITASNFWHRGGKTILKICVSIILLVLLFRQVPIQTVISTLLQINIQTALLAIVIAFLMLSCGAQQMRLILDVQNTPLSFGRILEVNLRVKFYSLFLPGFLSGGVLRWYYFSKDNKRRAQVAAAIGFNRAMETAVICAFGVIGWLLFDEDRLAAFSPLVVVSTLIPFFLVATFLSSRFLNFCLCSTDSRFCPALAAGRLRKVIISMKEFPHTEPRRLFIILLVCVVKHTLALLSTYLLALALGIEISILMLAFVRLCVDLLLMLPISLSGLGVRELSYVFLLGFVAVPAEAAIALGLAVYTRSLLFALIGGGIEFHQTFIGSRTVRSAERST